MSAELNQLKEIDADDFRIMSVSGESYLNLIPKDKDISPSGAVRINDKTLHWNIWLKSWNIGDLLEIELYGREVLSRKLTEQEKEAFERSRAKMIRCKKYSLNYYENELYDKL